MLDTLKAKWARVFAPRTPVVAVHQLPGYVHSFQTGDKWAGGFGATQLLITDYWTLRARSSQMFEQNLYARGLIRRLVTNVINTGLHLESTPEEVILGKPEDALVDWSEDVENRFALWGKTPWLCDDNERQSFGALQADAYREALVSGDVLVVVIQDRRTNLPRVRLVKGDAIRTPLNAKPQAGNTIHHGVELDGKGRHVAFWVRQSDGNYTRLAAWGEKSQRRLAWLVYGTDKRLDDVRGKPLLTLMLQSVREIDRYRDAVQRKAVINAVLAMFIKKTQDKPGTRPVTGAGISRRVDTIVDSTGTAKRQHITESIPGVVIEELQVGEEPVAFSNHGTDEKFGDFETAVLRTIAWAHEIPPEILELSFGSNYSASQAAINEFKLFLNPVRTHFGDQFCQPIYEDWLISQVITGRVKADGFLSANRDIRQYDIYGAWVSSAWCGHIKPAVDLSKLVRGYKDLITEGLITRDRASRELTGTKFSKNVKKLRTENAMLVEANKPIAELAASTSSRSRAPEAPPPETDDTTDGAPDDDDDAESRAGVVHIKRRLKA